MKNQRSLYKLLWLEGSLTPRIHGWISRGIKVYISTKFVMWSVIDVTTDNISQWATWTIKTNTTWPSVVTSMTDHTTNLVDIYTFIPRLIRPCIRGLSVASWICPIYAIAAPETTFLTTRCLCLVLSWTLSYIYVWPCTDLIHILLSMTFVKHFCNWFSHKVTLIGSWCFGLKILQKTISK